MRTFQLSLLAATLMLATGLLAPPAARSRLS